LTTPFFPLGLYEQDVANARRLGECLGAGTNLHELAIRFALSHPSVSSAILGFAEPAHIDKAVAANSAGALTIELRQQIRGCRDRLISARCHS
jgi:aryl-alcohol dehydrogenase-like predicted oxidoreductase